MRGIAGWIVIVVVPSAINGVLLFWMGGFWMTLWAITFGLAVPVASIAQALRFSREEDPDIPPSRRPSLLVLSSVVLMNAAMFPLIAKVWDQDDTPARVQACE